MTRSYCATIDKFRSAVAGAGFLATALIVAAGASGPAHAAPVPAGTGVPFALNAESTGYPVAADSGTELSGLSLLWRPGAGLDLKGEFRAAVPASAALGAFCPDAAVGLDCGAAWSPLDPSQAPAWREANLASEWEPLEGLRLGLDYYSRREAEPRAGALLLPRVLDFIAPGWEDSLASRSRDGEALDLSVAYGFDAGLIGELELQVQFSQVLNRETSEIRPLAGPAVGVLGQPENQATVGFNWSRGDFSGSVSSHYSDGIMMNGQVHPAAWTTVDINFAWRTPWNASLSLGAQNLLGQERAGSEIGMDAQTPPELESAFSRVPYVRYEQDL